MANSIMTNTNKKIYSNILIFLLLIFLSAGCASMGQQSQAEKEKLFTQYIQQGQAFEKQGNIIKALNEYKLALTVKPDDKETLDRRKDIEKKLRIIANKHYRLGLSYKRRGNAKMARQEFLAALRYWPSHKKAVRMLKGKPVETQPKVSSQEVIEHVIKPGESLSKVAILYYGDYKKYKMLADFNNIADPTQVKPGQVIRIPKLGDKPFLTTHKDDKVQVIQTQESKQEEPTLETNDETGSESQATEGQETPETTEMSSSDEADVSTYPDEDLTEQQDSTEELDTEQQEVGEQEEQDNTQPVDEIANYRELGIEFFNEKNYDEAISEFNKVLNANPDDESTKEYLYLAYYQPAMVSFEKGEFMDAKQKFENALNIKKDCKKCEEYIKKSLEAYKDVHYNKGISYFEKELLEDAIREWELVSKVDPEYKGVKNNIRKAQVLLKRLEDIKKSMKE